MKTTRILCALGFLVVVAMPAHAQLGGLKKKIQQKAGLSDKPAETKARWCRRHDPPRQVYLGRAGYYPGARRSR